jgi:hypothetical protein
MRGVGGMAWHGMGEDAFGGGSWAGSNGSGLAASPGTASRQQHGTPAARQQGQLPLYDCASAACLLLTHFHAQAPQSADEDVAGGHAPHALLAVNSQLQGGVGQLVAGA